MLHSGAGKEAFADSAEQTGWQQAIVEAACLDGRDRAKIGAWPDETVQLAHNDP